MTIAVDNIVTIRPWRGYDDPGLPVGMYIAQNIVTGDMSGGDMVVIFVFKNEGDPVSGRLFNIEQFTAIQSQPASLHVGALQSTNFEALFGIGLINNQWRFELEANSNGVAAINSQIYLPLPLFLGAAAPVASLSAQVEVSVDNDNNTTLAATIQGYIWEPRSLQAEGGLRRPVDSLYGGGGR